MPLINIKLIENVFTPEEKKDLIARMTDVIVAVKGESLRPVTWVVIEEMRSGDLGIGGQSVTTEAVRALSQSA